MNAPSAGQVPSAQAPVISVSVSISPRLKRVLYGTFLFLFIVSVFIYVLIRDWKAVQQSDALPATTGDQRSVTRGTMLMRKGAFGRTFTVTEARTYHLTVRGLTGSHIVINKWQTEPPVYSSRKNKKQGQDFDDEIYLESGEYVLTLVSKGERPADASIDLW